MKIKLEIPLKDFRDLIIKVGSFLNESEGIVKITRNQIIENGFYKFRFVKEAGYNHDSNKYENNSKIVMEIDSLPPTNDN